MTTVQTAVNIVGVIQTSWRFQDSLSWVTIKSGNRIRKNTDMTSEALKSYTWPRIHRVVIMPWYIRTVAQSVHAAIPSRLISFLEMRLNMTAGDENSATIRKVRIPRTKYVFADIPVDWTTGE